MKIYGKYEKNQNFTIVYCDDTIYEIARNTGDWGCVHVGERTAMGILLTKEIYDKSVSECKKEGTFILK